MSTARGISHLVINERGRHGRDLRTRRLHVTRLHSIEQASRVVGEGAGGCLRCINKMTAPASAATAAAEEAAERMGYKTEPGAAGRGTPTGCGMCVYGHGRVGEKPSMSPSIALHYGGRAVNVLSQWFEMIHPSVDPSLPHSNQDGNCSSREVISKWRFPLALFPSRAILVLDVLV